MKGSNSITKPNRFFAGALLALSLFGFLYPAHVNAQNSDSRVNVIEQTQTQRSDVNWGYRPPASPGSRRGWQFGS